MEDIKSEFNSPFNRYEEVDGRETIYSVNTGVEVFVIHIEDPALRFQYWENASWDYFRGSLFKEGPLTEFCPLLFDKQLINDEDPGLQLTFYQMRLIWEKRTRSDFHTKIVLITDLTVPEVLSAIAPCLRTCGIDDVSFTDIILSFKGKRSSVVKRLFSKSFKSFQSCLIKN